MMDLYISDSSPGDKEVVLIDIQARKQYHLDRQIWRVSTLPGVELTTLPGEEASHLDGWGTDHVPPRWGSKPLGRVRNWPHPYIYTCTCEAWRGCQDIEHRPQYIGSPPFCLQDVLSDWYVCEFVCPRHISDTLHINWHTEIHTLIHQNELLIILDCRR